LREGALVERDEQDVAEQFAAVDARGAGDKVDLGPAGVVYQRIHDGGC